VPSSASSKHQTGDDQLDRVFHALSDRTRRAVLCRLARGPASVSELAEPFAMSRPAVSKHLQVLEEASLIARAIDGRVHRCSLEALPLRDTAQWLETYSAFWDETLRALADYVEADHPPKPKGKSK
jgi:DNA-binding transcriptional ArsR family regulator